MTTTATALVATIITAGENLDRFSRRLASRVNQSPLHLARVISRGSQIYPVRLDSVGGTATYLECEFRPRQTGATVSKEVALDVYARLEHFEVVRLSLVDDAGTVVGNVGEIRAAG